MVSPEDLEDRPPQSPTRPHSPGEGTPRDSGDEMDPFLNRTVRSGANEMTQTQTGTDTLVSVPAAAALAGTASTRRSGTTTTTHVGGPIMPRDELLARMNEEDAALQRVRLVSPTSVGDDHTAPLPPPPPMGAERRTGRMSHQETKSTRSLASAAFSASSEKSGSVDAHEQERAELLTARRVKVSNLGQPASEAGTASITSGTSGLERLANLPRMSWFRRMSFLPAPSRPGSRDVEQGDNYTRTPPRSHSRQGSRSRPVSWAPLPTSEPTSPTPDSSANRRPRPPTAFPRGFGHLETEERPVSSVSAKSVSTVYHDARETPSSSLVDVNVTPAGTFGSNRSQPGSGIPPVPSLPHTRSAPLSPLALQTPDTRLRGGYLDIPSTEPPTYEESSRDSPHSSGDRPADTVDVLDLPVPRPASPFTAASGSTRSQHPPGLPNPAVWRESLATTGGTSSTSGIRIDVLEEAPPPAQDSWRTLSGGGSPAPGARRTTFGVVVSAVTLSHFLSLSHVSI